MEKVQAGSFTEEFSFSRALHLMRHSKTKVRMKNWKEGKYACVKGGNVVNEQGIALVCFGNHEIMANWTVYDERIHGE